MRKRDVRIFRVPSGSNAGGQFAPTSRPEADVDLSAAAVPADAATTAELPVADIAATDTAAIGVEPGPMPGPARAALSAARADGMHMSDDPRVGARYLALERAADREAADDARAQLPRPDATSEPDASLTEALSTADTAQLRAVEGQLARSRERAVALRATLFSTPKARQTPEQLTKSLSSPALRIALNGLRMSRRTAEGMRRIALIEAELARRASEGVDDVRHGSDGA